MSANEDMKKFKVGDRASFSHTITVDDIKKFVEITGDNNPLHVDREYAEKTQFKGIVAHGMLSASFISTLVGKHFPGDGALWLSQSLEFLRPVRIGDVLQISAEITAVHAEQRVLELSCEIKNQNDMPVVRGQSKVKVLEVIEKSEKAAGIATPRVVLITGASRGIGAATALTLSSLGYSVAVNYRSDEAGAYGVVKKIVDGGGKAIAIRGDVGNQKDASFIVAETIRRFGALSSVVCNATNPLVPKPFMNCTEEDFRSSYDVIFMGAVNVIRASLPHLGEASYPGVVTLATIMTDNQPPAQMASYAAAKAALVSLTKSLAVEYGPKGIRFNAIAPGMTDTGLISEFSDRARMTTKMQTPLRKLAEPEDIAESIAFLLSTKSKHITGEVMRVCGGAVML